MDVTDIRKCSQILYTIHVAILYEILKNNKHIGYVKPVQSDYHRSF